MAGSAEKPDATRRQLGPLETRLLLEFLCQPREATVRDVLAMRGIKAAYTTVMTTLDRLYKKGLLDRDMDAGGRAFRYRLKKNARELYQSIIGDDLNRLLTSSSDPSLPVSFLVDALSEHDPNLLDELTRAVNRKRRELQAKGAL